MSKLISPQFDWHKFSLQGVHWMDFILGEFLARHYFVAKGVHSYR